MFETNKKTLPLFIKFEESKNVLYMNPAINEKTGIFKICVKLIDSMGAENLYSFKIEIKAHLDEEAE